MHAQLQERIEALDDRLGIAILDVDLTLVDNAPRTRAIFCDWLHSVRHTWPQAEGLATRAQTMPLVFGVNDNLKALGVSDPGLRQAAFRFWLRTFFSEDYCRRDVPLPGAVDAVLHLLDRGVTVCYLTARTANMAAATTTMFQRAGFPIGLRQTMLVMKDSLMLNDSVFKQQALGWIGRLGEPVLCADNEPSHVNAMHDAFPKALTVLVGNRHSSPAPPPHPAILAAEHFADTVLGERA